MSFECRNATMADLDNIVKLHIDNFDSKELSSIIGKKFVRVFYQLSITAGSDVSVKVLSSETGQIAAISLVYFKYSAFEKVFRKNALLPFMMSVVRKFLKFEWNEIRFILRSIFSRNFHTYINNEGVYDHYIGSLIIGKENRANPPIIIAAYKMFSENVKRLKASSSNGVWASVRVSNAPSLKMMADQGLKENVTVKAFPEDISICIYRNPS
jgi:hypothetical protein